MAILDHSRDDNGLLYEVDETGAQELVRSVESAHPVYIRYTNTTSRPVNIWWRDFNGARKFYACLKTTGEYCDINTFFTHPWEFTDEATGERYNVGTQVIFRAPKPRGPVRYRSNWNISVSLRTLRDTALLQVALSIPDTVEVSSLGLPRELTQDLGKLVELMRQPQTLNQRLD